MNVLLVTEPGVDGVFRYVDTLCRYLWQQGVGVHLAYSDRRGSDRLFNLVAEVSERGGRTLNLHTANRPEMADGGALRSLFQLTREIRPDVIHSHSSKAGFLGRALRFGGVQAVQCYHPHAYVGMRPNPGRFDTVYNLIEGMLGRVANTIVVSSGEAAFARQRLKIPSSRLHLIPNGVDLGVFSPVSADEKRMLRKKLGLPLDTLLLGCMGRSSEQKDPLTLYRAFAHAAAVRPIALLHIGKGELDDVLEKFVQEKGLEGRLFRRAYTSNPVEFYRVVDGFILTSRYEGFSLAALEALAANLPIILSDAPGNCDLLEQPLSHCWKAAIGDVDGFARGIVDWHDRLTAEHRMVINHRQVAGEKFDVQERCGAVLRLYRRLMGKGSPETSVAQSQAA
jgi:glycosyltransferase involved in cell wall biosynthesis